MKIFPDSSYYDFKFEGTKLAIITVLTGGLERNIPRTCTVENASLATNGDNSRTQETFVADLAIDPVTKQVDFSRSVPISLVTHETQIRENMQQLLDIILGFFTMEEQKVENGTIPEEDMLFDPYVQEDDTNTKRATRLLPPGFKRRRA